MKKFKLGLICLFGFLFSMGVTACQMPGGESVASDPPAASESESESTVSEEAPVSESEEIVVSEEIMVSESEEIVVSEDIVASEEPTASESEAPLASDSEEIVSEPDPAVSESEEPVVSETESVETSEISETSETSEEEVFHFVFTLNSDKQSYSVVGAGDKTVTEIEIPATYENLPVTKLGQYAFYGFERLENVTIPDSIVELGYCSFACCYALKKLEIPNSVKTLGGSCINNCTSLEEIVFEDGTQLEFVDSYVFAGDIPMKNAVISDAFTTLGYGFFYANQKLETVKIPDGIQTIPDTAFYSCMNLKSVEIPASVTMVDLSAFVNCRALTTVYYHGTEEQWNAINFRDARCALKTATVYYNWTGETSETSESISEEPEASESEYPETGETEWFVFQLNEDKQSYTLTSGDTRLKDAVIPAEFNGLPVTQIASYAFSSRELLESVTVEGYNLTHIHSYAFANSANLKTVELPNSLTTIDTYAFVSCMNLKTVQLPDSLTKIDMYAFALCSALESVTLGEKESQLTIIDSYAFSECNALQTVYYGGSVDAWNSITIMGNNDPLINATIVCQGGTLPAVSENSGTSEDSETGEELPEGMIELRVTLGSYTGEMTTTTQVVEKGTTFGEFLKGHYPEYEETFWMVGLDRLWAEDSLNESCDITYFPSGMGMNTDLIVVYYGAEQPSITAPIPPMYLEDFGRMWIGTDVSDGWFESTTQNGYWTVNGETATSGKVELYGGETVVYYEGEKAPDGGEGGEGGEGETPMPSEYQVDCYIYFGEFESLLFNVFKLYEEASLQALYEEHWNIDESEYTFALENCHWYVNGKKVTDYTYVIDSECTVVCWAMDDEAKPFEISVQLENDESSKRTYSFEGPIDASYVLDMYEKDNSADVSLYDWNNPYETMTFDGLFIENYDLVGSESSYSVRAQIIDENGEGEYQMFTGKLSQAPTVSEFLTEIGLSADEYSVYGYGEQFTADEQVPIYQSLSIIKNSVISLPFTVKYCITDENGNVQEDSVVLEQVCTIESIVFIQNDIYEVTVDGVVMDGDESDFYNRHFYKDCTIEARAVFQYMIMIDDGENSRQETLTYSYAPSISMLASDLGIKDYTAYNWYVSGSFMTGDYILSSMPGIYEISITPKMISVDVSYTTADGELFDCIGMSFNGSKTLEEVLQLAFGEKFDAQAYEWKLTDYNYMEHIAELGHVLESNPGADGWNSTYYSVKGEARQIVISVVVNDVEQGSGTFEKGVMLSDVFAALGVSYDNVMYGWLEGKGVYSGSSELYWDWDYTVFNLPATVYLVTSE